MPKVLWGGLAICAGWGLFGFFHSFLCRTRVKRKAESLFGPPFLAGVYRPLYALLSTAYLVGLWRFSDGLQGDQVFFSLSRWMAPLPMMAKATAVIVGALSLREIGFSEFTGAGPILRWWRGELDSLPPTPPGEVAMAHQEKPFVYRGVYLWVRHPLNTAAFLWIWPQQNYTLYNIVFASCLTTYVLIANRFEEKDLIALYGDAYKNYRQVVPRFFSGFTDIPSRTRRLENLPIQKR